MGISCFQMNIFQMNSQKSFLNRHLSSISNQRDVISSRIAVLTTAKTKQVQDELNARMESGDTSAIASMIFDFSNDPEIKLLQSQDNTLDMEQKSFETQLAAITENLKKIEEAKDENIKNGVAKLSI